MELLMIWQVRTIPCQKVTSIPIPIRALDITWGTQVIDGEEVQPNQKNAIGSTTAPTIIGGRRCSGMGLPYFLNAGAKCTRVEYIMSDTPIKIPILAIVSNVSFDAGLRMYVHERDIG